MRAKTLMTQMKASISEVMETMFYYPVELKEELGLEESGFFQAENKVIIAAIDFSGPLNGRLFLMIPEDVLGLMAENLMGLETEKISTAHVTGTAQEALNMIAGNAFSKTPFDVPVDLGVPEIITALPDKGLDHILMVETMDGMVALGCDI